MPSTRKKKRRVRRPTPPPDPITDLINEVVGNLKTTAIDSVRQLLAPAKVDPVQLPVDREKIKDVEFTVRKS